MCLEECGFQKMFLFGGQFTVTPRISSRVINGAGG